MVALKEDKVQALNSWRPLSYAMLHSSSPGWVFMDIVVWKVECSRNSRKVTKEEKWVPSLSLA